MKIQVLRSISPQSPSHWHPYSRPSSIEALSNKASLRRSYPEAQATPQRPANIPSSILASAARTIALSTTKACLTTMKPATHISNPMKRPSDGTVTTPRPCTPFLHTTTNDRIPHPLLTRLPSYHKTHSRNLSPVSSVTTHITPRPCAPLLSKTSPQLQTYSTMMWEHQSTQRVMSLSLRPVQDSSLYGGKPDLVTPTKSWKSAPIVKALLTRLQNALLSLEKQGCQHHEDK